jgi:hypothetical protein
VKNISVEVEEQSVFSETWRQSAVKLSKEKLQVIFCNYSLEEKKFSSYFTAVYLIDDLVG